MKPINKSVILNVVLAIAVLTLGIRQVALDGNISERGDSQMALDGSETAVLDNIATRTSIRDYEDRPVENDKVEKMLRAAMAAPTAMNKQPWHFIVADKREVIDRLADANPRAKMLRKAPLAIVVCGDMDKAIEGGGRDFWIQDASAATENLLLAAHAMKLGAVWTGVYPAEDRTEAVKEVFNLPDNIIPLNIIAIGYPAESPMPKDKFKTENISYNAFKAPYAMTGDNDGGNGSDASGKTGTASSAELKPFDITKEMSTNPFSYFRGPGLLLCAGDKSSSNAMTIGWGALGTLWGKSAATVYVRADRYTHQFMERSKYFTIMQFADSKVPEYMGRHSGRDGDKAKTLGLHVAYTKNGAPYYKEASLVIECRTMYARQFDKKGFRDDVPRNFYASPDTKGFVHSEYIGEIVGAMKK